MLARTYKTARQLKIKQKEYDALLRTKEMLERGEAKHIPNFEGDYYRDDEKPAIDAKAFNMGVGACQLDRERVNKKCGTVACIGGWTASYMGAKTVHGMEKYVGHEHSDPLHPLFYPAESDDGAVFDISYEDITVRQAVKAIDNFLSTGEPRWAEVLEI